MKRWNETGAAELVIVGVIAAVLVGSTAVVVASGGSKPGDALYSIDRASESVRGAFVFGDEAKVDFKFAQATERLEELEALRNDNAPQARIDAAVNDYGVAISEAANRLAELAQTQSNAAEALVSLVAEATNVHLDILAKVYQESPEQAKTSIEKAMTSSEQGTERSLEVLGGSVAEEKRRQAEERVKASKELRGSPSGSPAEQGADNAEQGRGNAPAGSNAEQDRSNAPAARSPQ